MENPYAPPQAPVGVTDGERSDAIADLAACRPYFTALAVVAFVLACVRAFPLLGYLAYSSGPSVWVASAGFPVLAAVGLAVLFWRTGRVFERVRNGATFAALTYVIRTLSQLALYVAVTLVLPTFLSLFLGLAVVVGGIVERELTEASRRLRTVTYAVLVAGAFTAIARIGSMLMMSGYVSARTGLGAFLLSSVLQCALSIVLGWLLWGQISLVNGMIATPSSASVQAWVGSQRPLWRTIAMVSIGFIVIDIIASAAMLGLGI